MGEFKLKLVQVQEEQRRLTMQEEAKYHREKANYEDQLARKRYNDQLSANQQSQAEILRKQEESVAKQEELRRSSIKYEADLRHENEMKRVKAEPAGQAQVERENHDLRLEKIREVERTQKNKT